VDLKSRVEALDGRTRRSAKSALRVLTVSIVIITQGRSVRTSARVVSVLVSVVSVRHHLRPSPRKDFAWSRQMATSGERAFADLESVLDHGEALTRTVTKICTLCTTSTQRKQASVVKSLCSATVVHL
jgi:hypothetical protein